MNQLKHLMGIPITLPNGLALRGSTFSRSAGTNGRNPKRSSKLLVVTGDDDDSNEPKLSSKSYARIIEDYSKAIEARNAAAKLNGEAKTNKNRGFFSKTPFQRLARVSSLVNIKNTGNNGGPNLCTESSSTPPNTIKSGHKSHRSKSGIDARGIHDEINKRAEWLDHVVKAHNVKKITKNVNFDNDCDHGKAHNLVQRIPESRVTRNPTPLSFNDGCSSPVKKISATPTSDANNASKTSKTAMKMLKSMSDTSVHQTLSGKKVTDNLPTAVNKIATRAKAENTLPKIVSNTSVHKNLPVTKLQDNSISNLSNAPKKSTSAKTITKSLSNTSVDENSSVKKLPNNSKNDVNNMSRRIKTRNKITKSVSNTSVHKKLAGEKLPDNSTRDAKKSKPGSSITKSMSDTSVRHNKTSEIKIPENSARDVDNMPKKNKTRNTILRSISDKSLRHSSSVKKLPVNSARDANIVSRKSNTTGKMNIKNCSNPVDRYCSSIGKLPPSSANNLKNSLNLKTAPNAKTASNSRAAQNAAQNSKNAPIAVRNAKTAPIVLQRVRKTDKSPAHNSSSGDTNVVLSKQNKTKNLNQKSLNTSVDRSYSSLEKQSEPSKSDVKNISVIVQRLPRADKAREVSKPNSQDGNMMLVTVSEKSKSSSTSKSSPLRHIDLRINGKPAAEVDNVISKVDKLGVVSSAEKIEITIPVLSKGEEAVGDNPRATNSTINLCISSQAKESTASNKTGSTSRVAKRIDSASGRSRSCLTRPSTRITSSMKNVRRPGSSTYRSKVIPWWTNADSFRRSEVVSARSTKITTNTTNSAVKISRVGRSSARVNQEVHDWKPKKVAFADVRKTPNVVVAKPSVSKQQIHRRKRASAISKVIANETQKRLEREEQERQIRKQLTLERLKSYAKPEAKPDIKVKSAAANVPKPQSVVVDTAVPGKPAPAKTVTSESVSRKNGTLPKSAVAASGAKSITVEIEPEKKLDVSRNSNSSNPNNFQGRMRAKPMAEVIKGRLSASKNRKSTSPRQNSEVRTVPKITAKLRQEVIAKSDANATPQLPRTYGKIRLLPPSETLGKPGNRENDRQSSEPAKPSDITTGTVDKLSKVKNAAITMKPIEKKKDGTLIDYGVTVNTRKKPERILSGLESTVGLQGKKLTQQKGAAVVATVKEVMEPSRNKDTRSGAINPRSIDDSSRSRIHGLDKNVRPTSETRFSTGKSEDTVSKGTTNEPNESAKFKTSVNPEKRELQDSNDQRSPVIETASAADKKLVYSVWLRRFKERTGQDSDPTKDPSSRKP